MEFVETVARGGAAPRRVALAWAPATGFVIRERLLGRLLDHGLAPVVLIDGPAGSGKSTLARQWRQRDDRIHVEISASQAMDSPAILAQQLIAALETIGPSASKTRSIVTASEPTFSATLVPALGTLAGGRSRPYVLVIDDAHLLQDVDCWRLLSSVAYGIPDGSTLAVLSRELSPAWLATTRADGRLCRVDSAELAFDASEVAALFTAMGLQVTASVIERALESSGGWPAGLYLGALALESQIHSGSADINPMPGDSNRDIRNYVRTRILDPLDQETRDFLVHTAILEDLTPALCDAVTERCDSLARLTWLEEHIQLVVEVDPQRHRFRVHHLLREALLAELQCKKPDILPILHRRAAGWFRRRGELDTAIRHAHESRDLALLGNLVWSGVPACVGSGWPDRLRQWPAPLTDADVASDRWLTLSAAWSCLQGGERARMGLWLLTAEKHAGENWRARASSDEYAASLAAAAALVGRSGEADVHVLADAALRGLPVASPFRAVAAFLRGVALTFEGGIEEGSRSFREARELSRSLEVPIVEADALSWLGVLHLLRRETKEGLRLLDEAAVVLAKHDLESLATCAHSYSAMSLGQALTHDARARATLAKARTMTVSTEGIVPWFAVWGRLVQARAAVALGDRPLARQLLSDAKAHMTADLHSEVLVALLDDVEEKLQLLIVEGISAGCLTEAELRILRFLPSHLNYPQIGERLFVSPNTVKTHALSVYRKFNVSTRAEAVDRGRALGLLDEPPLE
jgi:LuxR family maltose regulon positive regulatory protein